MKYCIYNNIHFYITPFSTRGQPLMWFKIWQNELNHDIPFIGDTFKI